MRKLSITVVSMICVLIAGSSLYAAAISEQIAQEAASFLAESPYLADTVSYYTLDGEVIAYEFAIAKQSSRVAEYYPVVINELLTTQRAVQDEVAQYKTVVMAATTNAGPMLMTYNGLPTSALLRAEARDFIRRELGNGSITDERFIYFKIGFVFMFFEVDHSDFYFLSPRGAVVQVSGLEDIEYRRANPSLLSEQVDRSAEWHELLENAHIGSPLPLASAYTIVDASSIRDIFYNRGSYWPESTYPYLYENHQFEGCCTANSGLQICLYHDNHGYDNLVANPNTDQTNRLATMAQLVVQAYSPGERWESSVADYAGTKGYTFNYYYSYSVSQSVLISEINQNRPLQFQIYSTDSVVVQGYTYETFAHSVVCVGYNDPGTGSNFTVTLYWGWSSFAEVTFNLDSDFAKQFESKNFVRIVPVPSGDQWDPGDNNGSGATSVGTVRTYEQSHGPHILSSSDNYDWFKIYMSKSYTYILHTQGGTGDNYGELYSNAGGTNRVAYDDDSGGNRQFKISYKPATTGYYYLRVRSYSTGGNCSYSLRHKKM